MLIFQSNNIYQSWVTCQLFKEKKKNKQLSMRKTTEAHLQLYFVTRVGIHEAPKYNTHIYNPPSPLQAQQLGGDGL